jgi:cytochrome-b5 reductase
VQSVLTRSFASEAPKETPKAAPTPTPPPSGGSNTLLYVAGAAVAAGAGYYFFATPAGKSVAQQAEQKVKAATGPAKPAFTGGDQGFVSLVLENVEIVNHNTKKLRFKLPEDDNVSGLHIASAILTKYKGPEDEKPTLRPYTPVSDEGKPDIKQLFVLPVFIC